MLVRQCAELHFNDGISLSESSITVWVFFFFFNPHSFPFQVILFCVFSEINPYTNHLEWDKFVIAEPQAQFEVWYSHSTGRSVGKDPASKLGHMPQRTGEIMMPYQVGNNWPKTVISIFYSLYNWRRSRC